MRQPTTAALLLLPLLSACSGKVPVLESPTLRGHDEVLLRDDGGLLPLILPDQGKIGFCLEVAATQDTSRWKVTLTFDGRPSPSGAVGPSARSGSTVCYDAAPLPSLPEGTFDVCAAVTDEFDGAEYRVPCLGIRLLEDEATYAALLTARNRLIQRAHAQELASGQVLAELDEVAGTAAEHGFALFGVQVTLIAVHFLTLEGTPEALAEAERRLASLPPWLDRPEARHLAAMADYQRGLFYLDGEGRVDEAWSELAKADSNFRAIADPKRFTVTMAQASILHHVGAVGEAIRRLREALEECEPRIRDEDRALLEAGRSNLAWLLLLNPDASAGELIEAELYLEKDLAGDDRLELANRLLDLAYLDVRLGRDPLENLGHARGVLAALQLGEEHGRRLSAWADLVEAAAALEAGDARRALELCSAHTGHRDPFIAVWASRCSARAHRLEGHTEEAWYAIEAALFLAYDTAPRVAGQRWTLGPSQRAEDFAQAALIAIERGEAGRAWKLFLDLDRLSTGEAARRRCRGLANETEERRWVELESEIRSILQTFLLREVPASPERRAEQVQVLRAARSRLQELWQEWPGCAGDRPASDAGLKYRAFASEDEIVLLRRDDAGRVEVARRTAFPRRDLRELQDRIRGAFDRQDLDDTGWRDLLAPVAKALLPPDPAAEGPLVTYALHGLLQSVPLAALPLPEASDAAEEGRAARRRWLGQSTVVALQPAGARPAGDIGAGPGAPPLFVVDPRSNLPASSRLLSIYRRLFPEARILQGQAATYAAFLRESARAPWLHVDAHGLYDPVDPQLSAIQLADRPIHWIELAERPMAFRFAHLSGCKTGRWPITPDSGSYGIAGLATRLGTAWAIASRTDLSDRVAMDFNRVFYESIGSGLEVPEAFARAWKAVAERHPAGAWGGLVLLRAAAGEGV